MKLKRYLMILGIVAILSGGCTTVGISPGIGIGWGSGGRVSTGVSLNTWIKPDDDWGSDKRYRDFYIKNYKYLVKRYDKLISKGSPSADEIRELKIKMIALRQQVNTQWNDIEKRTEFIKNFNKDIDIYINDLENLELGI